MFVCINDLPNTGHRLFLCVCLGCWLFLCVCLVCCLFRFLLVGGWERTKDILQQNGTGHSCYWKGSGAVLSAGNAHNQIQHFPSFGVSGSCMVYFA